MQVSTIEQSAVTNSLRRYDVDWLRVLALALLIIYHAVLGFQPWARWIFFIQNDQSLDGLWLVMSIINVWRIPVLFLISGMGVCFAMERRDWKQLLKDRTIRILLPFVFGYFFICTISVYVALAFYGLKISYAPNAGHLWFLANIFSYVVLLLPLLVYLRNRPDHAVMGLLRKICRWRFGLFLFALPLMAETWLLNPATFEAYAMTPHGFGLGMVCFLTGFLFILLKEDFWQAIARVRWLALGLAAALYLVRLFVFELAAIPNWLIAFESMSWMLAILGHGSVYLNKSSASLSYFSKAVYPLYILHMPVQFCLSYFLFPLSLHAIVKLLLLLVGTFGASLLIYEFVIRRLKWVRPLFGMKLSGN